jgi:oligopeptide transport system substrate-binding protein
VPTSLIDLLSKRRDFHAAPFLGTYFLRFNCSRAPFDDTRVREAFTLAVDKRVIVEKITRAGELVAESFVPPGIPGYASPVAPLRDAERARALLAEAGFSGGTRFPLVTYLYSDSKVNEAIAVELQAMWKRELGIEVNLARQEWKVYLNSLSNLDFDIARSSWVGDYPDPNTFLDMFVSGGGNNRTGWASADYDALIAAAGRETDPVKRFAILHEAERMLIAEAMPVCPLFFYVGIQLYNPDRIGGIAPNLLDEHPLREMYRKDLAR